MKTARNARTGEILAKDVEEARSLPARMKGLLGRSGMAAGTALWLEPCTQVHTFFMAFPIDVLFLDREGRALRVVEDLRPWRISPWVLGASGCLELPSGALKGRVQAGDKVDFVQHG